MTTRIMRGHVLDRLAELADNSVHCLGRDCIGIELSADYAAMAEGRVRGDAPLLVQLAAD